MNVYLRFRQYDNGTLINEQYYIRKNVPASDNINSYEYNNFNRLEKIDVTQLLVKNHSLFEASKIHNMSFIKSGLFVSFTDHIKDVFSADDIEVAIAFSLIYDGTVVSHISHHTEDGAMHEIKSNVFDLLANKQYWRSPITINKLSQFSKHNIEDSEVRLHLNPYELTS